MGVLNVTPDSFSDGGRWLDRDAAIARGRALFAAGADIVDVGGESTRPGASRIPEEEELRRVLDVVAALADAGAVSIDTARARVAARTVAAGAVLVNDVTGGLGDEAMLGTVAELGVPYVVMHWRGPSAVMDELARYDDVVADVVREVGARVDAAVAAGVSAERIVVDPGLGFAKTAAHNWALLRRLDALQSLGHPVLVGASRKRFLGPERRDEATAAVSALAAAAGVWGVRVHEPAANVAAVEVGTAWRTGHP
jgi:dihydropteroate synthase